MCMVSIVLRSLTFEYLSTNVSGMTFLCEYLCLDVLRVLSRHVRGMGEPKAGLNNAIVVGAVNLVLDPVLMFGCGLGVAGAAMATAAAQWVRPCFLVCACVVDPFLRSPVLAFRCRCICMYYQTHQLESRP